MLTLLQPGSRAPGLRILGDRARRLGSHVAEGGAATALLLAQCGAVHPPTVTTGYAATADQAPAMGTKQEHPDYAPAE